MTKSIEGIIVPILTPITKEEAPQFEQLERLTNYVIEGGVNAIFANGTTGEFARFSSKEQGEVLRAIVKAAAGRVPVLAGVSECGTKRVMENIRQAEEAGADAVVTTLPYYFPTISIYEQKEFIRDITSCTKLPVILYNIPVTTGSKLEEPVLDEVCEISNLYGIKDSSGNAVYFDFLLEKYGARLKLFIGDEALSYYGLSHGANGLVPSLANAFPKLLSSVWKAAKEKDWESCKTHCNLVSTMNELNRFSDSWMSPNIWRKEALQQMGIIDATFTKPYSPMSQKDKEKVGEWISYYKEHYA